MGYKAGHSRLKPERPRLDQDLGRQVLLITQAGRQCARLWPRSLGQEGRERGGRGGRRKEETFLPISLLLPKAMSLRFFKEDPGLREGWGGLRSGRVYAPPLGAHSPAALTLLGWPQSARCLCLGARR